MVHHTSISLDYVGPYWRRRLRAPGAGKDADARKKTRATARHMLHLVAVCRAQGKTYWPPCDNVRPDGHCAGHP